MSQRGQHSRLTFKPSDSERVASEGFGEKFDRNTAAQFRVGGLIHVTHAAGAKVGCNLEMSYPGADHDLIS